MAKKTLSEQIADVAAANEAREAAIVEKAVEAIEGAKEPKGKKEKASKDS